MAESLQPLYQGMAHPIGIDVVEVVGTQFAVLLFAFEQVIGDYQQLVCDGNDGPLGSAAGCHASVECSQVVVLLG